MTRESRCFGAGFAAWCEQRPAVRHVVRSVSHRHLTNVSQKARIALRMNSVPSTPQPQFVVWLGITCDKPIYRQLGCLIAVVFVTVSEPLLLCVTQLLPSFFNFPLRILPLSRILLARLTKIVVRCLIFGESCRASFAQFAQFIALKRAVCLAELHCLNSWREQPLAQAIRLCPSATSS